MPNHSGHPLPLGVKWVIQKDGSRKRYVICRPYIPMKRKFARKKLLRLQSEGKDVLMFRAKANRSINNGVGTHVIYIQTDSGSASVDL